jgi:hypothetical protein
MKVYRRHVVVTHTRDESAVDRCVGSQSMPSPTVVRVTKHRAYASSVPRLPQSVEPDYDLAAHDRCEFLRLGQRMDMDLPPRCFHDVGWNHGISGASPHDSVNVLLVLA